MFFTPHDNTSRRQADHACTRNRRTIEFGWCACAPDERWYQDMTIGVSSVRGRARRTTCTSLRTPRPDRDGHLFYSGEKVQALNVTSL